MIDFYDAQNQILKLKKEAEEAAVDALIKDKAEIIDHIFDELIEEEFSCPDWLRFINDDIEADIILDELIQDRVDSLIAEHTSSHINTVTPEQLISQLNEMMSRESDLFVSVIQIKGKYIRGNGVLYGNYYYDTLQNENSYFSIKLLVPSSLRTQLQPGAVVILSGRVDRKIDSIRCAIDIQFKVDSIVQKVKDLAISIDDQKRLECRQRKVAAGFKNVDNILETAILRGERPKIGLLVAQNSITLDEFHSGKRAASANIDFYEKRVVFTRTTDLCRELKEMDGKGYSAIAMVRGGGIDPNTDVDKPEVIETVVCLNTPFISGLGHEPEKIFLRQVADKWTPTPTGLGQYFSELVENTAKKKRESLAAISEDYKKQQERNQQLIEQLTKTQEESRKDFENKIERLQETNKSLEKSKMKLHNSVVLCAFIAIAAIVAFIILIINK